MKNFSISIVLALVFLFFTPLDSNAFTFAKGIILDGEQLDMDVPPIIENGRTLVPIRGVLEAMGASVTWDQSTKTATAFLGENSASVTIDNKVAFVNGYPVLLDVPAKIVGGRTMVPLRFIAESIGYDVSFNDGWVYVYSPPEYYDFFSLLDFFYYDVVDSFLDSGSDDVNVFYDETEDAVVIAITSQGFSSNLKDILKTPGWESDWDILVESFAVLSLETINYFADYYYEVNSIVELIDDDNPGFVLLKVKNGFVIYDETGR